MELGLIVAIGDEHGLVMNDLPEPKTVADWNALAAIPLDVQKFVLVR